MKKIYTKPHIALSICFNVSNQLMEGSHDLQMDVYDEPMITNKNQIRTKKFIVWDFDDELEN